MKTNKFLTLILSLVAIIAITSCVEDDDFGTPIVNFTPVDLSSFGTKTTFAAVIARYNDAVADGDQVGAFDIENDAPLYIEGYVISSDRAGNFFEEIIIQNTTDENDAGTDPRRGLKVELNVSNLYNMYGFGRKIYIKLNGLAIGEENGVFTLGRAVGNSLDQIQDYEFLNFIKRDNEIASMTPKTVDASELSPMDENTLIQLDDMQIVRSELALSYAGEASDQFDGFRTLENCTTNSTIALQTSTFSDFKSAPVAQYRGSIQGIFTRDFGDDINVFVINSTDDVNFTNMERCDPVILECSGSTSTANEIFFEDFQGISDEDDLDGMGWTNVNVSGGSERYEDSSFGGDTYMKISAFGTNENPMEAWLVTPAINLDGSTEEELTFEISSNFETGRILTAFITENYTGDPTTTEWVELDANIPIGDGGFGDYAQSEINISCLNGDVHVAFKYLGAADGAETRYHINDIKVTGM